MPIGQGISVTPIQMASVYAAVANGGVWIQPHLVDRVGGRAPEVWKHRRLMSPAVDARGEVDAHRRRRRSGRDRQRGRRSPATRVAGKTGTAQVADARTATRRPTTPPRFVGMVPASHPRLVVLVKVDDPRGSIFGGVVAAPAFAAIAKFDLQYLEVPPDAPQTRTAPAARDPCAWAATPRRLAVGLSSAAERARRRR